MTVVPEPSSIVLAALGIGIALLWLRGPEGGAAAYPLDFLLAALVLNLK